MIGLATNEDIDELVQQQEVFTGRVAELEQVILDLNNKVIDLMNQLKIKTTEPKAESKPEPKPKE